ncbi:hypothetical protein DUI87_33729 [Hirundo rustica rustica]|uniref:MHC class I-like antigen recognition-like domain-containing protein n=1 Tax=Hirundo rustica rustica TaxID=333673 RepID=A0A3M0IMG9_HIRRU|nr:hypothetical protein DUI87_33729 [Hirundo rustica rustica]
MLPGLGGFVLGSVCLGWGSASPAGEGERPRIHRLGSDRREFLSFQLGSERFVVAAGAAQVTKRRWEHEEIQAEE